MTYNVFGGTLSLTQSISHEQVAPVLFKYVIFVEIFIHDKRSRRTHKL